MHMELLNSVLILIAIGLLWLLIVFFAFQKVAKKQQKGDKAMLFFGLLLFFVIGAVFVIGAGAVEFVDSPYFCGEVCHPMEPYYQSYENPGNNTMMATHETDEVTCANCHDGPMITGKVYALTVTSSKELFITATGNYDEDHLGGHVPNDRCTKCHDGSVAHEPGNVTSAIYLPVNPHNGTGNCAECHDPHMIGESLTEEACSVCHGTEIPDFEWRKKLPKYK